jgi:CBS domain-containing protein
LIRINVDQRQFDKTITFPLAAALFWSAVWRVADQRSFSRGNGEFSMKVKQAMHKGVQSREPSTPVAQLAKLMKSDDIGAVPITENGKLVGMVTDRDIAVRAVAEGRDVSKATARDVMSSGLTCCGEDEEIDQAVRLMEKKGIRRLPVTNAKKQLIGMLSLGDVSHAVGQDVSGELIKAVSAHH